MRWLVLLGLIGCGDNGGGGDTHFVLHEQGHLCLYGTSPQQTYAVGQPVRIGYTLSDVCLSSSCTIDEMASCSVTQDLQIATLTSWTSLAADACTADCGTLTAECMSPPLEAGTHTFTWGDKSISLTVPSQLVAAPCVDIPK